MKFKHVLSILGLLVVLAVSSWSMSMAMPTTAPTPEAPEKTTTPEAKIPEESTPFVIRVEPTFTPFAEVENQLTVDDLPVGHPGNYVNVTFGYWLKYPEDWYTGFGDRPLLVSLSNLDPGTHNRESMRREGCLIEVKASPNIYGLPVRDIATQLPKAFPNAEYFDLDGLPAVRSQQVSEDESLSSEWGHVLHHDRLFVIRLDYSPGAEDTCRPVWEELLSSWRWFEPEMAIYRNTDFGYAISHPRDWHRFNPWQEGISISSEDPMSVLTWEELLKKGMVVETDVLENLEGLLLKEWLAAQEWEIDLTTDIPLDGVIGVRVLREGPSPEVQEMAGYFLGPQGRIYEVACRFPYDRRWEFRPIGNAILYSFVF